MVLPIDSENIMVFIEYVNYKKYKVKFSRVSDVWNVIWNDIEFKLFNPNPELRKTLLTWIPIDEAIGFVMWFINVMPIDNLESKLFFRLMDEVKVYERLSEILNRLENK